MTILTSLLAPAIGNNSLKRVLKRVADTFTNVLGNELLSNFADYAQNWAAIMPVLYPDVWLQKAALLQISKEKEAAERYKQVFDLIQEYSPEQEPLLILQKAALKEFNIALLKELVIYPPLGDVAAKKIIKTLTTYYDSGDYKGRGIFEKDDRAILELLPQLIIADPSLIDDKVGKTQLETLLRYYTPRVIYIKIGTVFRESPLHKNDQIMKRIAEILFNIYDYDDTDRFLEGLKALMKDMPPSSNLCTYINHILLPQMLSDYRGLFTPQMRGLSREIRNQNIGKEMALKRIITHLVTGSSSQEASMEKFADLLVDFYKKRNADKSYEFASNDLEVNYDFFRALMSTSVLEQLKRQEKSIPEIYSNLSSANNDNSYRDVKLLLEKFLKSKKEAFSYILD